jgi:hypothetical protein
MMMKVKSLVELLMTCDPEAEVMLAVQQHSPIEAGLKGIALRKEFRPPLAPWKREARLERGTGETESDVLLVQGEHLRYTSYDPWDLARR